MSILSRFFKSKIKNSDNNTLKIERSRYFPDKFFTNKLITIDKSIEYFIKKSNIKIPDALFVEDMNTFAINGDPFECIIFSSKDRLLYDKINDTFYLMMYQSYDFQNMLIKQDTVKILGNDYETITDIMETSLDELYRIYSRQISHEADEYLFITVDKSMKETYWLSIILQPSLIG
jgi:hypothetical protein